MVVVVVVVTAVVTAVMINALSPRENPVLVKRLDGAVVKKTEEAEESRGRDRKREGEAEEILALRDVALGGVGVSGFGIEDQPAENARPSFQHLVRCTGMSITHLGTIPWGSVPP